MADRIQQRRDTAARWAQYNPILLEGEVGYVTDNPNQYKIGDGVHAWNDLPLRGYTGTIVQETGNDENTVMSQKAVTDLLNEGYLFKGIATPDTDPGTPDGKVFYIANFPGIYVNFSNQKIEDYGIYIIKSENDGWNSDKLSDLDYTNLELTNGMIGYVDTNGTYNSLSSSAKSRVVILKIKKGNVVTFSAQNATDVSQIGFATDIVTSGIIQICYGINDNATYYYIVPEDGFIYLTFNSSYPASLQIKKYAGCPNSILLSKGSLSSGSWIYNNGSRITPWLPYNDIKGLSVDNDKKIIVCFYDKNKNYLGSAYTYNKNTSYWYNDFNIDNAAYIVAVVQSISSIISDTEKVYLTYYTNNDDITISNTFIHGKSLEDIFLSPAINGWNMAIELGNSWTINNGTPTIIDDPSALTSSKLLKVFGDTSQNIVNSVTLTQNNVYFLALKEVTQRYTPVLNYDYLDKAQVGATIGNYLTIGKGCKNEDFETIASTFIYPGESGANNLYLGTSHSANIDALIDNVVICNLSVIFGEDLPTHEEMCQAYELFIAIMSGKNYGEKASIKEMDSSLFLAFGENELKECFMGKVNFKAELVGMTGSHFQNPGGSPNESQYCTAEDFMRLGVAATGNNKLMELWGWEQKDITIEGPNARTLTAVSTYKGSVASAVGDYYHIIGGKSGSWSYDPYATQNVVLVVKSSVSENWLVGCVMKSTNSDRFVPMKQIFDYLDSYIQNSETPQPAIEADYAAGCIVPIHNPNCYRDVNIMTFGKNATTKWYPLSMSKLISTMVVLENSQPYEFVEVWGSDIMAGSGLSFEDGDIMNLEDAIIAYMLPSSNSLSGLFGRFIGKKIAVQKAKKQIYRTLTTNV